MTTENFKKVEKEKVDLKRTIESKNDLIEKLKQDNSDMGNLINTEKFKTIKQMETELNTTLAHNKNLIIEVTQRNAEKIQLEAELKQFTLMLEKLTQDYEKKSQEDILSVNVLGENKILCIKINELERTMEFKEEELSTKHKTIEELLKENENLNDDIEYFKEMARTSKIHADRAISDIEVYKNMLLRSGLRPI